MLIRLIENILIAITSTVILSGLKIGWLSIRKALQAEPSPPRSTPPKKTVQRQFFISLSLLALFLLAAVVTSDVLRTVALIISSIAFLAVWGSFDTAISFYPDDPRNDPPADAPAHQSGKQ